MSSGVPVEAELEERLMVSFGRQTLMSTLAATLSVHGVGAVTVRVPAAPTLLQQHGFLHAGVIAAALDTACGYAAISTQPVGREVLTAEYKINLLAPARGSMLEATAETVRVGRTLIVCRGEASSDGETVAVMQATMVPVNDSGRPGAS